MEKLIVNPYELKDIIDTGTLISDKGFSGAVILYGNEVLKIHKRLYQDLKVNSKKLAERRFNDVYMWDKRPMVSEKQIEYLLSKQKDIKLTDFDKGIILVNNLICGTILANHLDYQDLTEINLQECSIKDLFIIIENILAAIRELDLQEISHLDLAKNERGKEATLNILYKDTNIKLCDLSGKFITYQEQFDREGMYQEFQKVLLILIKKLIKIDEKYISLLDELNNKNFTCFEDSRYTIKNIEKKLIK